MPPTFPQIWQKTVRQNPAATAVIDGGGGRTLSRGALAAAAAGWLAGLPPGATLAGRRVLMAEPNGPGWFEVFLGLLLAGAIPMPADAADPAAISNETAHGLGAAWVWRHGKLDPVSPRRPAARRDLCLAKLTSGSTGAPRARLFTHAQMLADGRQICSTVGIRPRDLNLAIIPLGHSYGLGNLVVPLLTQGTAVLCAASPLPNALAADCVRWRPTVFPAVPTLLRVLVRAEINPKDFASLRLVISAGSPLPPETAAAFAEKFGRKIHGFYGSSETGGITYDRTGGATLTGRGVGKPLNGIRLSFRRGGRFSVAGAAVMSPGRWAPPDRAKLGADGGLILLGRTGRTVKIAGRRLDLAEVETALRALPRVADALVIPHPQRPDALAAAVVSAAAAPALRRELQERLAGWKIPERILVLAEFPQTARGKTDRRRIETLLRG